MSAYFKQLSAVALLFVGSSIAYAAPTVGTVSCNGLGGIGAFTADVSYYDIGIAAPTTEHREPQYTPITVHVPLSNFPALFALAQDNRVVGSCTISVTSGNTTLRISLKEAVIASTSAVGGSDQSSGSPFAYTSVQFQVESYTAESRTDNPTS